MGASFERFVLESGGTSSTTSNHHHPPTISSSSPSKTTNDDDGGGGASRRNPKGYTRIEEWDEDRKAKYEGRGGEVAWEEKLMFEGQKYGDRLRQNEILMRHLNK